MRRGAAPLVCFGDQPDELLSFVCVRVCAEVCVIRERGSCVCESAMRRWRGRAGLERCVFEFGVSRSVMAGGVVAIVLGCPRARAALRPVPRVCAGRVRRVSRALSRERVFSSKMTYTT